MYLNSSFAISPVSGQAPYQEYRRMVWNRTGGALTQYGIYQFDLSYNAAAVESANSEGIALPIVANDYWGDLYAQKASCWNNIVATGATIASGVNSTLYNGVFCVAQAAAADNEKVEVVVVGLTALYVIGATTAIYPAGSAGYTTVGTASLTYVQLANANNLGKKLVRLRAPYTEATTPAATLQSTAATLPMFNGFGIS